LQPKKNVLEYGTKEKTDSKDRIVTGLRDKRSEVIVPARKDIYLFFKLLARLSGSHSLLYNGYWGSVPGEKRLGRDVEHLPQYSPEVTNE
jgi:hypothetical protein